MTDERNPLEPLEMGDDRSLRADPQFADRLEASLRVAHADQRLSPPPIWRRVAVVAPTLVLLLAVATVVVLARDESPSAALVLTDANNVTIHLPDGSSLTDPVDGFLLVDGAVIEIRDGGSATIDEITVETAGVLTVRDGALVSDVAGTTTTDQPPGTTTSAPVTDRTPASVADGDRTSTTAVPTSSRQADSPTTVPPATRPADGRTPDDTRDQVPTDDQGDHRVALEIGLRVRVGDGGVRVAWNVAGAQDGWTIMVIRRTGDPAPASGLGAGIDALLAEPGVVLIDERSGAGAGELADRVVLGDGPVRYRVLVLDGARGIVASSPAQIVGR